MKEKKSDFISMDEIEHWYTTVSSSELKNAKAIEDFREEVQWYINANREKMEYLREFQKELWRIDRSINSDMNEDDIARLRNKIRLYASVYLNKE